MSVEHDFHKALARRFWAKVHIGDVCWNWTGSHHKRGYGRFWAGGRLQQATRVSYELLIGPIPEGMVLDHLCRNTACVNPDHLEPVSQQTNIHRGFAPAAANVAKTHCPQGHEYTEENTRVAYGKRYCRECKRQYERRYYQQTKAAA